MCERRPQEHVRTTPMVVLTMRARNISYREGSIWLGPLPPFKTA